MSQREVIVRFLVNPDDEDNLCFRDALEQAWRKVLGNPGESYAVISDTHASGSSRNESEEH